MSIERPLGAVLVPSQTGLGDSPISSGRGPQAGGQLSLSRIPWEGGPAWWTVAQNGSKMTKAESMGWAEDTFFPIMVFLSDPVNAGVLASLGINTAMGSFGTSDSLSRWSAAGMFCFPNYDDPQFTLSFVNTSDNCPGWLVHDEPDQNISEATFYADVATVRAFNDGRFVMTNYGQGALGFSHWGDEGAHPGAMNTSMSLIDAACVDKYIYSSEFQQELMHHCPRWPAGTTLAAARRAASYGFLTDQLRYYMEVNTPDTLRPNWIFLEAKIPFLSDQDNAVVPLYAEMAGAAWSSIAHEARGIAWFQHNPTTDNTNPAIDPNTGAATCTSTMSLVDCEQGLKDAVTDLHTKILGLAPVINTQSYVFDFGPTDIDTMLKAKDGFAYIFASVGLIPGTLGNRTFTMTGSGITGTTVEVLHESRTINISGGQFTDSFPNEYSHHIYKVAI